MTDFDTGTDTTTETNTQRKTRGKSSGYRLRFRNGRWNWKIRKGKFKDHGPLSGTYEPGTSQDDARKMTLEYLRELETQNSDTIENQTLKKYSVLQLIETFETHWQLKKLREQNATWRNEAKMILLRMKV